MSRETIPCIICGKKLENVFATAKNQPYGATAFQSHGHYGSTAFDPMDGTYIEINICDPCLLQAQLADEVFGGPDSKRLF